MTKIIFQYKEPLILLSRDRPRPSGNTTPTTILRPICDERKIPLKTVKQTLGQNLYHTLKRKIHVVKEHIVKKHSTSGSVTDSKACQALGNSNGKAEKLGYQPMTLESSQLSNDPSTMGPFSTKVAFKDSNLGSLTIFSLEAPINSSVDHALCSLDLRGATGAKRAPKPDMTSIHGGAPPLLPRSILQNPGKTAVLSVLPPITPLDLHQVNSLEKPTASHDVYSLCRLSAEELRQMKCQTNELNQKKFSEILREYHNNQTIVLSIRLQLESLKVAHKTPQIEKVLKELELELKYQKDQENELEQELQKISSRRSDIYPAFTMPKRYGRKGTYEYERIEGIPIFNPDDKNTRLSHTWALIKSMALAPENDWSKECIKTVLYNRLKGEAVDYFIEYKDSPLEDLIIILSKRFEVHRKKSDFEDEFERFQKSPKETLLACITRLQYIIRRMLCDNTTEEKRIMEKQFLRVKLKKLVPKTVWHQTLGLENTRLETGDNFDLVHEIQIAEKSYNESLGNDLNSLTTSLQLLQTNSTSKKDPLKYANDSSSGLAEESISIGKGQKGEVTTSNQGQKFRSRTRKGSTPFPSPRGSRSPSYDSSDPNENFANEDNCFTLYGHACDDQKEKCSYCYKDYHYESDLNPDLNHDYENSYQNDYDHSYQNDPNHYDHAHERNRLDDHENDEFIHSHQECPLAY
jgi:hypothetical protein